MEELKIPGQEVEKPVNTLGSLPPLPPTHPNEMGEKVEDTKNTELGNVYFEEGKKKKNNFLNILMGVALIVLVAGAATASYFISKRLSSNVAVAPSAPASKPQAGEGDGCPQKPCDKGYICVQNAKGNGVCKKATEGVPANLDCSNSTDCSGSGGVPYDVIVCGTQVCNSNTQICCPNGCKTKDVGCSTDDNSTSNKCSALKPSDNQIKFKKDGVIQIFSKHLNGKVSIQPPMPPCPEGQVCPQVMPEPIVVNVSGMGMIKEINVKAGSVYGITAFVGTEEKPGLGWIKNKSASKCGPEKSKCGDDTDISDLIALAENTSVLDADNIVINGSGGKKATVQCWGDAKTGNDTTDYDYNDFTLAIGYKKVVAGPVCNKVVILYKDTSGSWETITDTENLAKYFNTGDDIMIGVLGGSTATKARFRATVNGLDVFDTNNADTTLSGWVESTDYDVENTSRAFYYTFKLPTSGSYSFFAEVQ